MFVLLQYKQKPVGCQCTGTHRHKNTLKILGSVRNVSEENEVDFCPNSQEIPGCEPDNQYVDATVLFAVEDVRAEFV